MNSPYPEEFNRQAIGLTASLHFAPTQKAADALLKEGRIQSRFLSQEIQELMLCTIRCEMIFITRKQNGQKAAD